MCLYNTTSSTFSRSTKRFIAADRELDPNSHPSQNTAVFENKSHDRSLVYFSFFSSSFTCVTIILNAITLAIGILSTGICVGSEVFVVNHICAWTIWNANNQRKLQRLQYYIKCGCCAFCYFVSITFCLSLSIPDWYKINHLLTVLVYHNPWKTTLFFHLVCACTCMSVRYAHQRERERDPAQVYLVNWYAHAHTFFFLSSKLS